MWIFLAALVALQIYFVRELLAALFLFTLGFGALAGVALVFFLFERAGHRSMAWGCSKTLVKGHSAVHVQSLPSNPARLTGNQEKRVKTPPEEAKCCPTLRHRRPI